MVKQKSVKIRAMQPGEIIQTNAIKDQEFVFRYPQPTDLEGLRDYINQLSAERTFIRFQGTQVSLEEEEKYLA